MADFSPGDKFADYVIDRELGRGGMGVVLLAQQPSLGRRVALKVITPLLAQDEMFRRRFEHEARSAAAIDHPNVVPIYATGIDEGHLYMAMRFVDGHDLGVRLYERGQLSADEVTTIATQVAAALDAAHARGLIHRDVKPANILISGSSDPPHCYLGDFGLTKDSSSTSNITNTGQWVGTLDYVAPEQIEGGIVDARTDVYAMTCVVFQMLAGVPPYQGQEAQKMWSHMQHEPPSLAQHRPELAAAFDPVIARGMAKAPDDRYQSAGDLGRAVGAASVGGQVTLAERSVATGAAAYGLNTAEPAQPTRDMRRAPTSQRPTPQQPAYAPATPPPPVSPAAPKSNRWKIAAALAGLLLVAGAGVAIGLTSLNSDPKANDAELEPLPEDEQDEGGDGNSGGAQNSKANEPRDTEPASPLSPTSYQAYRPSDSAYNYFAKLPTGNGWSQPIESRPTSGALLRTTVRGPEGSLLIIDRTPSDVPILGGGFDSTQEVPHPAFGTMTEYVISESSAIPECSGQQCVDYLIDDGQGGGWGVLAGGPNIALATEIASTTAKSVDE